MIEYLQGRIAELSPTVAVVDVHGVGYELNITLNTFSDLQTKTDIKLYIHEVIREDAWTLYGFATARERELFRQLIGVSGVGSASARMILSSIPPAELEGVIASGDERRLKAVKGIGGKTAQRIIVDLRDKIKTTGDTLLALQDHNDIFDEALAALVMLGFTKQASEKVVAKLLKENPTLKVEDVIKKSLSML
ncbi:MAG: Holliday junction branch migration protein RuvA [Muribaculaceae bacterium]|nr:Holliday junction branch migration protein RuvA [Muribaculaceae bacterium]